MTGIVEQVDKVVYNSYLELLKASLSDRAYRIPEGIWNAGHPNLSWLS